MPTYKFFRHPRFLMMVARLAPLGCNEFTLYGHIARLEEWLGDEHAEGDLTGVEDEIIEAAAGWLNEKPDWSGKLAQALRESGLVYADDDGRTRFRGWPDHASHAIKMRLYRARRKAEDDDSDEVDDRVQHRDTPVNGDARGDTPLHDVHRISPRGEGRRGEENTENNVPPAAPAGLDKNTPALGEDSGKSPAGAVGAVAFAVGADGDADLAEDIRRLADSRSRAFARLFGDGTSVAEFLRLPVETRTALVADAAGCDASMRVALGKRARNDPHVFAALWRAFVSQAAAPTGRIKNRGGWMRTRLASTGVVL